jgi:ABC-type antimicrobial peptide transport system permease subunit
MAQMPAVAPQGDDPQEWMAYGLALLEGVPLGIEGGVRQQQAALALIQAQRCGLSAEAIERALAAPLARQLVGLGPALGLPVF